MSDKIYPELNYKQIEKELPDWKEERLSLVRNINKFGNALAELDAKIRHYEHSKDEQQNLIPVASEEE